PRYLRNATVVGGPALHTFADVRENGRGRSTHGSALRIREAGRSARATEPDLARHLGDGHAEIVVSTTKATRAGPILGAGQHAHPLLDPHDGPADALAGDLVGGAVPVGGARRTLRRRGAHALADAAAVYGARVP